MQLKQKTYTSVEPSKSQCYLSFFILSTNYLKRQTMNSLSSVIYSSFLEGLCEKCFSKLAGIKSGHHSIFTTKNICSPALLSLVVGVLQGVTSFLSLDRLLCQGPDCKDNKSVCLCMCVCAHVQSMLKYKPSHIRICCFSR